jgi:MFS family permease
VVKVLDRQAVERATLTEDRHMPAPPEQSFLTTRRGKLTLVLLGAIAFLDFVDGSIVGVALPSIRHALHVSVADLQWVPSGYLLTYGGFMLLGGRAADLLGRRRVLVAGIVLIGLSSLSAGSPTAPECWSAPAWRRGWVPR